MNFEVFRRMTFRGRRWFWHLKARNHEIVCSGQSSGYANKGDVLRIIDKIAAVDTAQIKFLD
jgi:uncharacterized protein YegP (UPF0339 family)